MKIPDKANTVFEGIRFNVLQWEQELFDGNTTIFEGVRRKESVQIIVIQDNKILLLEEEQPGQKQYVGLLGGVVERNEDVPIAAKREFKEETGFTPQNVQRLFSVNVTCIDWETT